MLYLLVPLMYIGCWLPLLINKVFRRDCDPHRDIMISVICGILTIIIFIIGVVWVISHVRVSLI